MEEETENPLRSKEISYLAGDSNWINSSSIVVNKDKDNVMELPRWPQRGVFFHHREKIQSEWTSPFPDKSNFCREMHI